MRLLFSTSLTWPNDLTLDFSTLTLYWVDAHLDKMESSHIDGTNRTLITNSLLLHPFSLTIFEGVLYWSDWAFDQILSTSLSNPQSVTTVIPRMTTDPMALKVVHPSRQPLGEIKR